MVQIALVARSSKICRQVLLDVDDLSQIFKSITLSLVVDSSWHAQIIASLARQLPWLILRLGSLALEHVDVKLIILVGATDAPLLLMQRLLFQLLLGQRLVIQDLS